MQLDAVLEREIFDEAGYLRRYADVARDVEAGKLLSGWLHYDRHGRKEGRQLCELDAAFYLRSYPLAREEIAAGLAASPLEHYVRFGRGRGYIPHATAPRPDNAAALPRFGGFWFDQPNGADIIAGKLETGQITERQAALVRDFAERGYVVLEGAIPPELVARATAGFDAAYAGAYKQLMFECYNVSKQYTTWQKEINLYPSKALDIHHFSGAIRDLIFADAIVDFLALLFDSKVLASQSLGFLRGSAQPGHQDSAYVVYSVPRQFAASWIALEDVSIGAGELFYHVGSHRFEDYLYAGRYKSVSEAKRLAQGAKLKEEELGHIKSLQARAAARGIEKSVFAAKKGDVLIWHSDLIHGGNPVSREITRKSVVTHYCPKRLAPLFAEWLPTKHYDHNGHRFTTSYYLDSDPLP
jgi:ectoine hydroxylase-related dioxygenase (phytanoyl-CoA dioxygenase family)